MTSVVTSLSGRKQADVYTKVAGRLSFIGPKEGEAVKSGQVIFRVDRSDPGESFLSTPVVSPITGWVGRWYATSLGEQLTTSTPVVTVVDDEILRAVVELPTREWLLVNKETSAEVEVGGEKRTAKVVAVARSGSANSGRGSVTVEIENPGRTWRSGMVARVKLGLEPRPRMVIPSSALIMTDQGTFVYVADNGIARRTSIDFTMIDADSVEVTRGLDDGAVVIIAGTNLLSDQAPIRVVNGNEDGRRSE